MKDMTKTITTKMSIKSDNFQEMKNMIVQTPMMVKMFLIKFTQMEVNNSDNDEVQETTLVTKEPTAISLN